MLIIMNMNHNELFKKVAFYRTDSSTGLTFEIFDWTDHFSEISKVSPMVEKVFHWTDF